MKGFVVKALAALSGLLLSSVAFAQDAAAGGASPNGLAAIGAGLAIGLAAFGAASAQGKTTSSTVEGIARNPNAKDALFTPFILGLVFMEFQALLGFVIAILWTTK